MSESNHSTGAEVFIDALQQYGVTHIFGNPGTTELPIMKAIADSELEYVLGLHEDIAVGMAAGYAATRRYHAHHNPVVNPVGIVNLHVAPGVAHGLGNIQNAHIAGVPLVITAGNHSTDFRHEEPILSGDLVEMTDQYTKWSAEVQDVSALTTMIRRAVRIALTPPAGPVFLGLPMDVMMAETDDKPERLGNIPRGGRGDPTQIEHTVNALVQAKDPVIVLGDAVARTGPDAIESAVRLAEASGAPVYSEMITAEVSFPPNHEQWISFVPPSADAGRKLLNGDVLVFVGCSTNTTYIPHEEPFIPNGATLIHIGDDPWELGKNEPADFTIIGDAGFIMDEIAAQVDDELPNARFEERIERIPNRKAVAREQTEPTETNTNQSKISKSQLVGALRTAVPDPFIVNESNTSKYPLLTGWQLGPEQLLAAKNGGLGWGLPAAVGAALAWDNYPEERTVIGFIGDGSYLYYPQTLYSAVRYDLDLTIVVPNNRNYRILKDGMLTLYGGTDDDHEYIGMDFDPAIDISTNAESHGARGICVNKPSELNETIHEAVSVDGPVVVDALVHD